MSASTKLKRSLALALAGGSLAIGVPAALAATGGGGETAPASSPDAPAFIQDAQEGQGQARPDRGDCPEKDGGGSGQGGGSSSSSDAEAPAPSV